MKMFNNNKMWTLRMTNKNTGAVYLYTWESDLHETRRERERVRDSIDSKQIKNPFKDSENYGTTNFTNGERRLMMKRVNKSTSINIGRMGTDQPLKWLNEKTHDEELNQLKTHILSQWETIQKEWHKKVSKWQQTNVVV